MSFFIKTLPFKDDTEEEHIDTAHCAYVHDVFSVHLLVFFRNLFIAAILKIFSEYATICADEQFNVNQFVQYTVLRISAQWNYDKTMNKKTNIKRPF